MTFTSGKRKKRRNTVSSGDLSDSSSRRNRSSVDNRRRARTTDDLDTTTPDPDFNPRRIDAASPSPARDNASQDRRASANNRRDRSNSDSAVQRQQRAQSADASPRRQTIDALDARPNREQEAASPAEPVRVVPTSPPRPRSLSEAAATIDPDVTVPDLRPARARALSEGGDPSAFRARRLSAENIEALADSLDRSNIEDIPLVREMSLNDSTQDNDEDNFIEEDDPDLGRSIVLVRRSSYSQDQSTWTPLPPEADAALRAVQDDFRDVDPGSDDAPVQAENMLARLLPYLYAEDGQGVSRDMLNEIYFLAKNRIEQVADNSLISDELLSNAGKARIQTLIRLVKAIDQMPDRRAFLVPEEAQAYNSVELSIADIESAELAEHNQEVARAYGPDLTAVSFNRTQENSVIHAAISSYRRAVMDRAMTDLEALEAIFKAKTFQDNLHKSMREAGESLRQAIERARQHLDDPTDANTQKAIVNLQIAIALMRAEAQNYINANQQNSGQPSRVRVKVSQDVLDRLDQLLVTDDQIISSRLEESFQKIEAARNALRQLSEKSADEFDKAMEKVLTDVTTGEVVSFSAIKAAFGLMKEFDPVAADTDAGNATKGFSFAGTGTANLLKDLVAAVSFIKALKEKGFVPKRDAAKGAGIAASITKNTGSAVSSGVELAKSATAVSETVAAVGQAFSGVAGGIGAALGIGVAVHGGLIVHKTHKRKAAAREISDPQIRAQVVSRISTKRRRALFKAVGGGVAFVGGVLTVVATVASLGAIVPVVVGIGAVISVGIAGERGSRAAVKSLKGTKGREREELATAIYAHMNELLASGNYAKAKELARALTNNKAKQNLMLRGADANASTEEQQAALVIMRDKLKTW